jgi:hypothetical protein
VRHVGYLLELYRDAWSPEYKKVTRNLITSAVYTEKLSFNFNTSIHSTAVMINVLRNQLTGFLSSVMKLQDGKKPFKAIHWK